MKRALTILIFAALAAGLLLATAASPSQAQGEYRLNLHRNFGFSSGKQIKGNFTISVVGPDNIRSVTFLIDEQPMAVVEQPPFSYKFETTKYPFGPHTLSARITTTDGSTVNPDPRQVNFATSEDEGKAVTGILLPLFGGLLVVMAVGMGLQFLTLRGKPAHAAGTPHNYGLNGGAICPHCKSPTPLHWWGINLSFRHKFDRCENCGRFGMMKQVSREILDQADAALRKDAETEIVSGQSEEEKLRSQLDKSRYIE